MASASLAMRPLAALRAKLPLVRFKHSARETHLYLKSDVDGLGKKGEIVLASESSARNYLVPFNLAYYVPRIDGMPILPKGWQPRPAQSTDNVDMILPALSNVQYVESPLLAASRHDINSRLRSPGGDAAGSPSSDLDATAGEDTAQHFELTAEQRAKADTDLRAAIASIPMPIVFKGVPISADSTKIYGSIAPQDIGMRLEEEFRIHIDRDMISIEHRRIKTLGKHVAQVRFHSDLSPVQIDILVEDDQSA